MKYSTRNAAVQKIDKVNLQNAALGQRYCDF